MCQPPTHVNVVCDADHVLGLDGVEHTPRDGQVVEQAQHQAAPLLHLDRGCERALAWQVTASSTQHAARSSAHLIQ